MATVDPFRPHEVIERRVISNDPVITVELATLKMLDDDSLAYGCRAWSSVHSRVTSLYDNEQEATKEVAGFMIGVPNEVSK